MRMFLFKVPYSHNCFTVVYVFYLLDVHNEVHDVSHFLQYSMGKMLASLIFQNWPCLWSESTAKSFAPANGS